MTLTKVSYSMIAGSSVNAVDFGANPNNSDNQSAIQAAIDFLGVAGGTVIVPSGNYIIASTLVLPSYCRIIGEGFSATILTYTGGGDTYAIHANKSPSTNGYGIQISDLSIILTNKNGRGIYLQDTISANITNVYLEGVTSDYATRSNVGITIEGDTYGSWYNAITNVNCNHMNIGYYIVRLSNSSSQWATIQHFYNCNVFGDVASGDTNSKGYIFYNAAAGSDSVIVGGNLENIACGISIGGATIPGGPITAFGLRFENNTLDVDFGTSLSNSIVSTSLSYTKINASYIGYQTLQIKDTGSPPSYNIGFTNPWVNAPGVLRFASNGSSNVGLGVFNSDNSNATDTYPGRLIFQAGSLSGNWGGAITLQGGASANNPGGVDLGLTGGTGRFRVTEGGFSNTTIAAVNTNGEFVSRRIVSSAAFSPGAGFGALRWETGTNAGTLKLVAYSGTSTMGVTIVDNVGSGN